MFLYSKLFPATYPIAVTLYRVTFVGTIFTVPTTLKGILVTMFLYSKLFPATYPVTVTYNPVTLIGTIFSTSPTL